MITLVFDIDDTLYSQVDIFEKTYKELFDDSIDISRLYQLSRYYSDLKFEDSQNGLMTMEDYHIYRFKMACRDMDKIVTDNEAKLFQKIYRKNQENMNVSQEMIEVLDYCKTNSIKLAVISNGPSVHQWFKVKSLDLINWIPKDNIFISYDVGINKPNSGIFKYVEEKLQLDLENTYYIGDSVENDVIGCYNANWKIIWLNRYNATLKNKYKVHKEVTNNKELADYLMKLLKNN